MEHKANNNKREAIENALALLNGATGTVSNKTSEAHTALALDTAQCREKIRTEIYRIMDQYSEQIKRTFTQFGIEVGRISAGFRISGDTKSVYEKLRQAQIAPEKERSSQPGRQQ